MENEEVNKYLTEKMGKCYHDWKLVEDTPPFRVYQCWKCDLEQINPNDNTDFFTWEGFGKLREFHDSWPKKKKDDFWNFVLHGGIVDYGEGSSRLIIQTLHKELFAFIVYNYLKESEVLTCPLCRKKVEHDHNSFTCHNCRKTWPKGFDHENQGE